MPRVTIHAQADVTMPKPGIGNAVRRRLGIPAPTYVAPLVAEAVVELERGERAPQVIIRRDITGLFLLVLMDGVPGRGRIVSTSLREVGEERTNGHRVLVAPLPEPVAVATEPAPVQFAAEMWVSPTCTLADWSKGQPLKYVSTPTGEDSVFISLLGTKGPDSAVTAIPTDQVETIFELPPGTLDMMGEGGHTLAALHQGDAAAMAPGVHHLAAMLDAGHKPARCPTVHYLGLPVADDQRAAMMKARAADAAHVAAEVAPLFPVGTDVPLNAGETGTPTSATSVLHDLAFIAERLEVAQFQIAFTAGGADANSVENDAHVALKALQLLREKVTTMHAQAQQAVRSVEAARGLVASAGTHPVTLTAGREGWLKQMGVHLDNARHHARRAKAEHNPALDLRESAE
ncbi:hypothetical protein W2_gp039c [Caulobacter phage W2]|uniref:Uncharacterized protein n=1 Tax=Caulobacter phage TMCBR4 TaxID=3028191 RepID=A0AAE9ZHT9_9CAUD|nr:hypothetical protein TMCBR4_gp040c [Caulobacter phage TMCBR4]WDS38407.1 hypothetical protein W2_gp039c [Caulobacter phage W2]